MNLTDVAVVILFFEYFKCLRMIVKSLQHAAVRIRVVRDIAIKRLC